jgi:hypothetical protein
MQKARSQETSGPKTQAPSYRLLACGFRLSFTPRTGVLFTCPSRYSSTIGHTGVFRLGGWSPQLHARLLGSGVTQELHYVRSLVVAYRALTVSGAPFQETSAGFIATVRGSYNPPPTRSRVWAWAGFARRYFRHLN